MINSHRGQGPGPRKNRWLLAAGHSQGSELNSSSALAPWPWPLGAIPWCVHLSPAQDQQGDSMGPQGLPHGQSRLIFLVPTTGVHNGRPLLKAEVRLSQALTCIYLRVAES